MVEPRVTPLGSIDATAGQRRSRGPVELLGEYSVHVSDCKSVVAEWLACHHVRDFPMLEAEESLECRQVAGPLAARIALLSGALLGCWKQRRGSGGVAGFSKLTLCRELSAALIEIERDVLLVEEVMASRVMALFCCAGRGVLRRRVWSTWPGVDMAQRMLLLRQR